MSKKKTKKEKILSQVRRERGIRRKIALELGIPIVPHTIEQKTKKDQAAKEPKTIKDWEE